MQGFSILHVFKNKQPVDIFITYFLILIMGFSIIMQLLRIVRILFNPVILRRRVFEFPQTKFMRVLYLLSAIMVLVMAILLRLDIL